jgi:hypothetical protein
MPQLRSTQLPPSVTAAVVASGLIVLLAAGDAWADLFGGDIPLLGTLVTQGTQELQAAAQLIRTANEQLAAAKKVAGYAEDAKAALAHFQHYSVADFGDDVLGLTGDAVPVTDARRLASGVSSWAPSTGELRTMLRRCLASEGSGGPACRQMHAAITQEDARRALAHTFGSARTPETAAADYEAARALSAADTHLEQEARRAAMSAAQRKSTCGPDLDAQACALAQTARQESQLDTVNAQLAEGNRLAATTLALKNAVRKRALAEAAERREQVTKTLDLLGNPAVQVQGEGVTLGGD